MTFCFSLVILPTVATFLARIPYLKALSYFADRSTVFIPIPDVPEELQTDLHDCSVYLIPLVASVHRWKSTVARMRNKVLWLLLSIVIILFQIIDTYGYQLFP